MNAVHHIVLFFLFIFSAGYLAWYALDKGYRKGYVKGYMDGTMMRKASTTEGDYGE